MNKKLFSILSLLIVGSMLLAACGTGAATEAPAEPEVLRVWIQWGDNPQQIQALFDKYTAESGIKVEVTAPLEEDKLLPSLTGSEPPDVLVLSGGDLVKSYYKEGLVDDLTGAVQAGGILPVG
jgi:ABC-type glycerol-3-phosphate transport system substrate-binding protein